MADPSPPDAGVTPDADPGQVPDDGVTDPEAPDGQGRQYTEAYVKQLRRESAGLRTKLGELEDRLQEREDEDKSEQQKLVDRATAAEKRADDAELKLTRYEVAAEHGLDLEATKFLTGSTREELELRAEELSKLLADKATKPTTSFDGGARQPAPDTRTPEQAHNDLLMDALGRSRQRAS